MLDTRSNWKTGSSPNQKLNGPLYPCPPLAYKAWIPTYHSHWKPFILKPNNLPLSRRHTAYFSKNYAEGKTENGSNDRISTYCLFNPFLLIRVLSWPDLKTVLNNYYNRAILFFIYC